MASRHHTIWEDESVRNLAFSIVLFALALMQIAVVSTELRHSSVQVAAPAKVDSETRLVLAPTETERKVSAL